MRNLLRDWVVSSTIAATMACVSTAAAESGPAESSASAARPVRFGAVVGIDALGSTTYSSSSAQAIGIFVGFKAPWFTLGVGGQWFLPSAIWSGSRRLSEVVIGAFRIEGQVTLLRSPDERLETFVLAAYGWADGDPLLDDQSVSVKPPMGPIHFGIGVRFWPEKWVNVHLATGIIGTWNSRSAPQFNVEGDYATSTTVAPFARLGISFVPGK